MNKINLTKPCKNMEPVYFEQIYKNGLWLEIQKTDQDEEF